MCKTAMLTIALAAFATPAMGLTETFDIAPTLSATQAPGVWYTDRYAPNGFTTAVFDGDNRLKLSIDATDGRTASGDFYNTQGRKLDLPAGTTYLAIDMYVPAAWETTGRRMGALWATDVDGGGTLTERYPIVEFASGGFKAWGQDNAWHSLGLPTGFAYDAWYTLQLELVGANAVLSVGDLSYSDSAIGAVEFSNVILQGYNSYTDSAGVTYDVYFDNLTTVPAEAEVIPEPMTMLAVGMAVAGLGGYIRKRRMA